nr:MAG TPA: hypothetical protein [Caudoviricetes sp.]
MGLLSNRTPCIFRGFVLYSQSRGVENLLKRNRTVTAIFLRP